MKAKKSSTKSSTYPAHSATKLSKTDQSQPKTDQQDLKALQKQWYAKLKATGFNDLEKIGPDGEPLDLLNTNSLNRLAANYRPETETYYRRLTNYLTHNPRWAGNNKTRQLVAELYVGGLSYRKISAQLRATKYKLSIWSVHKIIKLLEAKAKLWNTINPEGLDFESY